MKLLLVVALAIASVRSRNCPTRRREPSTSADTYFGKTYKDPYRWLEDLKDQAVEAWFKSQAALTDDLLAKIPARDALAEEWMKLDKLQPAKYNTILFENGRVFYKKTLGGENVGKLYYRDGWRGAEKLLFDPSTFKPKGAKEGDVTTIQGIAASPDGKLVALGFSAAGAEYSEIKIIDVAKQELLPESCIPRTARSAGPWTRKSLLYDMGKVHDIKSPEIELNRKTKVHRLGTTVAADVDFFSTRANPDLGIAPKEFPQAFIDESYPDYVIGYVGTVQQEMRLYYAPVLADEGGQGPVERARQDHRQSGPRPRLLRRPRLRGDARRRAPVQARPDQHQASRLVQGRDGPARGARTRSSTSPSRRASCSSSTPTGSPAASSSTT